MAIMPIGAACLLIPMMAQFTSQSRWCAYPWTLQELFVERELKKLPVMQATILLKKKKMLKRVQNRVLKVKQVTLVPLKINLSPQRLKSSLKSRNSLRVAKIYLKYLSMNLEQKSRLILKIEQ